MPLNKYELKMPRAVFSGENALDNLTAVAAGSKKIVVFTDRGINDAGLLNAPLKYLNSNGALIEVIDDLPVEPSIDVVEIIIEEFKTFKADFIVAIGGGSVMDVAKLASVLNTNEYNVRDLLDKPEIARKFTKTTMIPTTAGTGSEATPNSIVLIPEKSLKVGIINEEMISDYVILDAEMIKNLPQKIAATTGIDALAHCLECFTSRKSNPFSDAFASEGLKLIFNNIERACNKNDMEAKRAMMIASFFGGISITSSGTTAVHALSYPLGGKYHIPHGMANAILLLPVMKFNESACKERFAAIYDIVNPNGDLKETEKKSGWVISRLAEILANLAIPTTLKSFNINREDLDELVDSGMKVTRLLDNNIQMVKPEDAKKIYLEVILSNKEHPDVQN
jgi:alcohol dehydrogenase